MDAQIPLSKPYFDHDEVDAVQRVLDSGWVTQGPAVKEFERKFAERCGAGYAVAVNNCTAALHLALLASGVSRGDEVLVADFTFPATGHAVLYCGGKPVFVDVDPHTYNMDPSLIEGAITKRTKAVIPVHTFGQAADMKPIMDAAGDHGLMVIEDAACAHGAKYGGRSVGSIGDIGCFSFHARKGITTGEGGMIVTDDKGLADRMRHLSTFGMKAAWERESAEEFNVPSFTDVGYNYKLSDINAAIGLIQLERLDRVIERKRELAGYFNEKLSGMSLIEAPYESPRSFHVYQSYVALVDKGVRRNRLIKLLKDAGIQAQIGTYASHIQPVYASKHRCPVSLDIYERSLALPFYYSLTEADIDRMSDVLGPLLEECR